MAENPEAPEHPRPVRTWRPMVLWTAAILLALGLVWFVGFRWLSTSELKLKKSSYLKIVDEILAGTLKPDASGTIVLPASHSNVTPGGKVYAETRPGNHLLVLFPTCYGRGSDLQGYLYSNVPLTTRDYYTVNWGAGGIARHLKVGPIDLLTVNPVEAPWYEVTRLVD